MCMPCARASRTSRFVKRLYVPLPDRSGRRQLMDILLKSSAHELSSADIEAIVDGTDGERTFNLVPLSPPVSPIPANCTNYYTNYSGP